jgi:hypothetical protein
MATEIDRAAWAPELAEGAARGSELFAGHHSSGLQGPTVPHTTTFPFQLFVRMEPP